MDLTSGSSLGLDATRAADPSAYGMSRGTPKVAVKPASPDEVAEALRAAAADGLRVVPWGGGVSLHQLEAPREYDVALDLTGLNAIVEHDPEDFTITAQCGVTLDALRAALDAHRQESPLEGSRAHQATLGGVLVSNTSGARRRRFGAPVDRVLGARFVLGDGTIARTGGKVVKNVAGYAVHRLLCGSRGGLSVILEASLKLAPQPEVRRALVYGMSARDVHDAKRWSVFPRMEPSVLSVVGREMARTLHVASPVPNDFVVIAGFEDDAAWVNEQTATAIDALGEPDARIEGDDVFEMWQALADLEELPPPRLSFTSAHNVPAALAHVPEDHATSCVFHAPAGRLHVHLDPGSAPALATRLTEHGFTPIDARGVAPPPPPPGNRTSIDGMRERLRAALDPGGRFVLGRRG